MISLQEGNINCSPMLWDFFATAIPFLETS